jgi:hypothetical protein
VGGVTSPQLTSPGLLPHRFRTRVSRSEWRGWGPSAAAGSVRPSVTTAAADADAPPRAAVGLHDDAERERPPCFDSEMPWPPRQPARHQTNRLVSYPTAAAFRKAPPVSA